MHSESDSRSTGHEILCLLRNLKGYYPTRKMQPVDPIISQLNAVHVFTHFIYKIDHIVLSFYLRLCSD